MERNLVGIIAKRLLTDGNYSPICNYFEKENIWLKVNLWKPYSATLINSICVRIFLQHVNIWCTKYNGFLNWYTLLRLSFLRYVIRKCFFYLGFLNYFSLILLANCVRRFSLRRRNVSGVECSCWMKGKKEDLLLKWLTSWRKWFSRVLIWSWFTRRFQLLS